MELKRLTRGKQYRVKTLTEEHRIMGCCLHQNKITLYINETRKGDGPQVELHLTLTAADLEYINERMTK